MTKVNEFMLNERQSPIFLTKKKPTEKSQWAYLLPFLRVVRVVLRPLVKDVPLPLHGRGHDFLSLLELLPVGVGFGERRLLSFA